jgi:CheY-like chemotaxis protein
MRILVVEDNPVMRRALVLALEQRGHWVCWADNGVAALEKMRIEKLDLIFLDLLLGPGIDGWEVARRKMQDPAIAHIPIGVITALSAHDLHSREEAHVLDGAIFFLGKPIDSDRLDEVLGLAKKE